MITVNEAITIILDQALSLGTQQIALEDSLNHILMEDLFADRDFPPYDRVTMDGIAFQFEAYAKGLRNLPVEGIAAAGDAQKKMDNNQACLEVMTGSILPNNCDTVIRYEDLTIENGQATINVEKVKSEQNIHRKGEDRKAGDLLLAKGCLIGAAEIGVAATIGKAHLTVAKFPKAIIISTGDELVAVDQTPEPHQIRRSNVKSIKAALEVFPMQVDTAHLNDNFEEIKNTLEGFLKDYDVIIMSGGVSMGKFDFLPKALKELDVEQLFHKVKQRPGKPFWFGKSKDNCVVFALPGNPVSTFMCTQRYIIPWLEKSLSLNPSSIRKAILAEGFTFKPDLDYYLQVKLSYDEEGKTWATPVTGNGSGDLANLIEADAFLELPRGKEVFEKGAVFRVWEYR